MGLRRALRLIRVAFPRTLRFAGLAASFALAALGLLADALAQENAPPPSPTATEETTPPKLVEAAEPLLPDDGTVQGEVAVILRIVVDRDGKVTSAEVVESRGERLDEAARSAALRSRFEPARRSDGTAVPARILYRIVCRRATAATPPEPPATPAVPVAGTAEVPRTPAPERARPAASGETIDDAPPEEVSVLGRQTSTQALQQSAEAVLVYDLRKHHGQASDLGELLARMEGVSVRREGGLGSTTQFGMNGCYEDQIRNFFDGVPLEYAGFLFGIANVPVNLVQRVELYRGVVPIRFGADSLCGAANLVSDQSYRTRAGGSYQVGSFSSHRLTLDGMYHDPKSGLVAGGTLFADKTKNDYEIDVLVSDSSGLLTPATVRRFHDRYSATGLSVQVGVVDRPWARRLLLQAFTSAYYKERQHNLVMTVPYGEVAWDERTSGVTLRYDVPLARNVELELTGNYSHRVLDFVDKSRWVYDWYGRKVNERLEGGEIDGDPSDRTFWQNAVFSRAYVKWAISAAQELRFAVAANFVTRTGDERIQPAGSRDPLEGARDLLKAVGGVEYEVKPWNDRLANIVFAKNYLYSVSSVEVIPGNIRRPKNTDSHTQGIGDSLRFRFTPWMYAKASYEYATRLPNPDEVFGNGALIEANLELVPETSHNGNLGPRVELENTRAGTFVVDVNAFVREKSNQIVLLGDERFLRWQNVFKVRNVGVEGSFTWVAPATRVLALGGTFTWNDERNASKEGTFRDFEGDRIPRRPWLFGSWHARLHFNGVPGADDAIEPYYFGRYVHDYFRAWESEGLREYKQVVPTQVTHALGVSWFVRRTHVSWGSTFEVDNVTDAKVFDHFGLQRPGRAFYVKMAGEFR